jgi:thiol-disulfide isomerase/thioredoxin
MKIYTLLAFLLTACGSEEVPIPIEIHPIANEIVEEVQCDTEKKPDGSKITIRDKAGEKITLVTIHAGWCGICRRQASELEELYQTYKNDGLEIILINFEDPRRNTDRLSLFLYTCEEKSLYDMTFTVTIDPFKKAIEDYYEDAVPLNFILDSELKKYILYRGYDKFGIERILKRMINE